MSVFSLISACEMLTLYFLQQFNSYVLGFLELLLPLSIGSVVLLAEQWSPSVFYYRPQITFSLR